MLAPVVARDACWLQATLYHAVLETIIVAVALETAIISVTAVAFLDFSITAGSCDRLLGPDGAGNTTTTRMIMGMTPTSSFAASFESTIGAFARFNVQRWDATVATPVRLAEPLMGELI